MSKIFYARKDALGWPVPGTMMSAAAAVPPGNVEIPAVDATAGAIHPQGLRYFVRHDGKGNIIPNSLIISIKKPKGNVYEFRATIAHRKTPGSVFFGFNVLAENPSFGVRMEVTSDGLGPVNVRVKWGDGTIEDFALEEGISTHLSHIYAEGSYDGEILFEDSSRIVQFLINDND